MLEKPKKIKLAIYLMFATFCYELVIFFLVEQPGKAAVGMFFSLMWLLFLVHNINLGKDWARFLTNVRYVLGLIVTVISFVGFLNDIGEASNAYVNVDKLIVVIVAFLYIAFIALFGIILYLINCKESVEWFKEIKRISISLKSENNQQKVKAKTRQGEDETQRKCDNKDNIKSNADSTQQYAQQDSEEHWKAEEAKWREEAEKAKRKAEEAQRLAEQERQRKQEDARRKEEQERLRKAEEEKRKREQEEARRRAEEERIRREEEARQRERENQYSQSQAEAHWKSEEAKWQAEAENAKRKAEEARRKAEQERIRFEQEEARRRAEQERQRSEQNNSNEQTEEEAIIGLIKDAFDTFKLPYNATFEEVKKKRIFLLKFFHPDHHYENKEAEQFATEEVRRINEAYEVLKMFFEGKNKDS